jgi:phosphoglycerate dehydrogenase-like enzyme
MPPLKAFGVFVGHCHGHTSPTLKRILGLGNVGSGVAKVGLAVGMNVIAWSQNLTSDAAAAAGARVVSKEELLRTADVISIHMV